LPFLILASFLRALEDARYLPKSAFFITPGIFVTIFLITLVALLTALYLQSRVNVEYQKIMLGMGVVLLIYPMSIFLKNVYILEPLTYTGFALLVSSTVVILALYFLKIPFLMGGWVYSIFIAHFLDASATVVAVELYGYWEEHVFENFLIRQSGSALILFPFKTAVLVLAIYVINRILHKEKNFWYLALFILGFSPGLRDLLKVMLLG